MGSRGPESHSAHGFPEGVDDQVVVWSARNDLDPSGLDIKHDRACANGTAQTGESPSTSGPSSPQRLRGVPPVRLGRLG